MSPSKTLISVVLPLIYLSRIQQQRHLSYFALAAPPPAAFSSFSQPTSSCPRSTNMRYWLASRTRRPSSVSSCTQARYPGDIETNPLRLSISILSKGPLATGASDVVGSENGIGVRRTPILNSQRSPNRNVAMIASSRVESPTDHRGGLSGASSVNWPLWYVLPIAPYQKRKTLMKEIVPGKVSESSVMSHLARSYFRVSLCRP